MAHRSAIAELRRRWQCGWLGGAKALRRALRKIDELLDE
jgi:hypothetical protein